MARNFNSQTGPRWIAGSNNDFDGHDQEGYSDEEDSDIELKRLRPNGPRYQRHTQELPEPSDRPSSTASSLDKGKQGKNIQFSTLDKIKCKVEGCRFKFHDGMREESGWKIASAIQHHANSHEMGFCRISLQGIKYVACSEFDCGNFVTTGTKMCEACAQHRITDTDNKKKKVQRDSPPVEEKTTATATDLAVSIPDAKSAPLAKIQPLTTVPQCSPSRLKRDASIQSTKSTSPPRRSMPVPQTTSTTIAVEQDTVNDNRIHIAEGIKCSHCNIVDTSTG